METVTEEKLKPNAIETIVCVAIDNAPKFPMSEDVTRMMITLLLSKDDVNIPENEKPFLYQLIEKRVKHCFNYTIDAKLNLFLCLVAGSPGNAVLYLWYLQYCSRNRNIKEFTLETFCDLFPVGFPSDDDMSEIWRSQKVALSPDNLVDHSDAGVSLFKK